LIFAGCQKNHGMCREAKTWWSIPSDSWKMVSSMQPTHNCGLINYSCWPNWHNFDTMLPTHQIPFFSHQIASTGDVCFWSKTPHLRTKRETNWEVVGYLQEYILASETCRGDTESCSSRAQISGNRWK
jgi:hypothetical protein